MFINHTPVFLFSIFYILLRSWCDHMMFPCDIYFLIICFEWTSSYEEVFHDTMEKKRRNDTDLVFLFEVYYTAQGLQNHKIQWMIYIKSL